LQRDKSYILSKISNLRYNCSYDKREDLEFLLYKIKSQLKQEFPNSINQYWAKKIKNVYKNVSASMFPQINQICRPKESNSIPFLKLPPDENDCVQRVMSIG
jgi:hypothetical protein